MKKYVVFRYDYLVKDLVFDSETEAKEFIECNNYLFGLGLDLRIEEIEISDDQEIS